jgi:hypothetical protein
MSTGRKKQLKGEGPGLKVNGTEKKKKREQEPAVQMMIKTQTAQHKVPIESDKGEPKHENN